MPASLKYSPSFERNIVPITEKLATLLPSEKAFALEIGSGSGQHAAHLAKHFSNIEFQPSELDVNSLASINSWADELDVKNIRLAITLDTKSAGWRVQDNFFHALLAFNVIHYSDWVTTESIFKNAGRHLTHDGRIFFYGPFKIDGAHTSESNADFENWLKEQNPNFGVRDIGEVDEVAQRFGFTLDALHPMPANNFMPVFKRS